jgi:biotin carboxyl carrier protein
MTGMTGRLAPARVAILEREPLASRVALAIVASGEGSGDELQAALITRAGAPTGPAARLVPATIPMEGDPWRAPDLERALAADRPGLLWAGWAGAEHALAVAEACERLGIRVVLPGPDVLRALGDPAQCAELAGLARATRLPGERTRRLEAETVADGRGTVWVLGLREVFARGGDGVVIAEAPALLAAETAAALEQAAARLHRELGERFGSSTAAGGLTSEFAVAPDGAIQLVDVTAAAQPWAAATEIVTGADVIALRLAVALGGTLEGSPPTATGHAVTAMLRAEDPLEGFRPGTGRVEAVRFPGGPGLRTDPAVGPGDRVEPVTESEGAALAAITAWAPDRPAALGRLRRALEDTLVAIPGAPNDRSFLLWLLREDPADPAVLAGAVDDLVAAEGAEIALVDAAIAAHADALDEERARFYGAAARGRPEVHDAVGRAFELRHGRATHGVRVLEVGPSRFRVTAGGHAIPVTVEESGPHERRLVTAAGRHHVVVVRHDAEHRVEVDGTPHRITRGEGTVVRAPAPAVVVQTHVQPGDEVQAGDPLVVVEAMKMEMSVTAPAAGTVTSVVARNVQVGPGDPVARLAPRAEAQGDLPPPRFERLAVAPEAAASPEAERRRTSEDLRRLVLGYDVDAADAAGLASQWVAVCADLPPEDDDAAFRAEDEVLAVFADLLAVSAPRMPAGPEAEFLRAPADPFPAYLRSLDPADETLPASFLEDLQRALAHYGIRSLAPTEELRRAVYQMARSHQRAALQAPAIVAILDRRLQHVEELREHAGPEGRDLLDRLITVAQPRLPAVADLAREVRYRYFDQPVVEHAFDLHYRRAQRHLAAFALKPGADHRRRIQALVGSRPRPRRTRPCSRCSSVGTTASGSSRTWRPPAATAARWSLPRTSTRAPTSGWSPRRATSPSSPILPERWRPRRPRPPAGSRSSPTTSCGTRMPFPPTTSPNGSGRPSTRRGIPAGSGAPWSRWPARGATWRRRARGTSRSGRPRPAAPSSRTGRTGGSIR